MSWHAIDDLVPVVVQVQCHSRFESDANVGFRIGSMFASIWEYHGSFECSERVKSTVGGFDVFHEVRNDRGAEDDCRAEINIQLRVTAHTKHGIQYNDVLESVWCMTISKI